MSPISWEIYEPEVILRGESRVPVCVCVCVCVCVWGGQGLSFDLDPIVQKNVGRLSLLSRKFFRYIKAIAGLSVAAPCFARERGGVSCVKSTSCRKPGLSGLMVPARVSTGGCHGDLSEDFLPFSTPGDRPWIRGGRGPLQ
jgi:hypothetical protein